VQTEYDPYFSLLRQHPRMLVGQQVPSLTGADGEMETLRDANDAREYQEAVKVLLTEEVRERTTAAMEENKGILDTVSASIELFTQNKDLVPGTRQFDRALADRFAAMAKPYELRVDGKLHGFTIPVQPLIDSLRAQLVAERAAARPAAGSAPAAAPARQAARPADPPQAGIGSKAGSASDGEEDFSTLFGTLGLPNFRI
jgi:predicted house-cleaning noncanonical NTP pyrophosphatase (MazG superfamily)